MSFSSETTKTGPLSGDGTNTSFGYEFLIIASSHLEVIHADADGIETVLTEGTHYSVDSVGNSAGGTVTYPLSGSPLPANETLTFRRNPPWTQGASFPLHGGYIGPNHEAVFDQIVMQVLYLREELSRAVKVGISTTDLPDDLLDNIIQAVADANAHMVGAQTAQTAAETAQTNAETAQTGSEAAKAGSEAARDLAKTYRDEAQTAAQNTYSVFKYTATGGETSLSGPDDNANTLAYVPGVIIVEMNGAVLEDGVDFTATTGTSITGLAALSAGDTVIIRAFGSFSVTDHETKTIGPHGLDQTVSTTSSPRFEGVNPTTPSTASLGSSLARWFKGWFGSLDVSGAVVCGDTITSGSDFILNGVGTSSSSRFRAINSEGRADFGTDGGNGVCWVNGGAAISQIWYANLDVEFRGTVLVGKSSSSLSTAGHEFMGASEARHTVDANTVMQLNRLTDDGTILGLRQDGAQEGQISVSGTTVSFQGGHLARLAQLPDGSLDTSIVKGTVLANLDAMCMWKFVRFDEEYEAEPEIMAQEAVEAVPMIVDEETGVVTQYPVPAKEPVEYKPAVMATRNIYELYSGVASVGDEIDYEYEGKVYRVTVQEEANEQLNRLKVSDVEGDTNVAGVFVNWDQDDGYNDMNIAMTGDMIIRIGSGITVQRGDLLMSAGDGTAKPQGDDIVRSSTIAKVTSINISHVYADGTYLVPCVLMAC